MGASGCTLVSSWVSLEVSLTSFGRSWVCSWRLWETLGGSWGSDSGLHAAGLRFRDSDPCLPGHQIPYPERPFWLVFGSKWLGSSSQVGYCQAINNYGKSQTSVILRPVGFYQHVAGIERSSYSDSGPGRLRAQILGFLPLASWASSSLRMVNTMSKSLCFRL